MLHLPSPWSYRLRHRPAVLASHSRALKQLLNVENKTTCRTDLQIRGLGGQTCLRLQQHEPGGAPGRRRRMLQQRRQPRNVCVTSCFAPFYLFPRREGCCKLTDGSSEMGDTGEYKEVPVMLEEGGGCSHNLLLTDPETPQLHLEPPSSWGTAPNPSKPNGKVLLLLGCMAKRARRFPASAEVPPPANQRRKIKQNKKNQQASSTVQPNFPPRVEKRLLQKREGGRDGREECRGEITSTESICSIFAALRD